MQCIQAAVVVCCRCELLTIQGKGPALLDWPRHALDSRIPNPICIATYAVSSFNYIQSAYRERLPCGHVPCRSRTP